MAKAMISQPMAGKTEKEIVETRENAITFLKERGYDIVNTLFTDDWYSDKAMQERLPKSVYKKLKKTIEDGALLPRQIS